MAEIRQQLQKLRGAVPVFSERARARAQGRRAVGLQQRLGAVSAGTPGQVAQQLATQEATRQNQINLTAQQQQQQQLAGVANQTLDQAQEIQRRDIQKQQTTQKLELNRQQQMQQINLAREDLRSRKEITSLEQQQVERLQNYGIEQDNRLLGLTIKQREDLTKLGRDVKAQLFDSRMRFKRDELGRKFSNERQLWDYKISKAKSDIEVQEFQRELQQKTEQKITMLKTAIGNIKTAINRGYLDEKQQLDFQSEQELREMVYAAQRRVKRHEIRGRNTAMWIGAGAKIIRAIIGAG